MTNREEYTVRVKDRRQDLTHTLHYIADSQQEADDAALEYLRLALRHQEFHILSPKEVKRPQLAAQRVPNVPVLAGPFEVQVIPASVLRADKY